MKSDTYGSADIEICARKQHRLQTAWSDKNPMKVSIMCRTCSEATHKSVYVAYGVEQGSFGAWRPRRVETVEVEPEAIEAQ